MPAASSLIGLLQFPGSNCDADCRDALQMHFDISLLPIWHTAPTLPPLGGLIIPGGFSYGDYLRAGHLASLATVMPAVIAFARQGGAILGICNGFQILTEAGLLPGALVRNSQRNFVCEQVSLHCHTDGPSPYQQRSQGQHLTLPIAHGQGRYVISGDQRRSLYDQGQVVYTYEGTNPNGSVDAIAGVCSPNGKILGLMPHPERATHPLLGGSEDGLQVLASFLAVCT